MLQQMFGTQLAFPIRVAVAAVVIAALLGLTVLVMRRLAARGRSGEKRGRAGPRLAVLDTVSVDQRRRLVLVRRDDVEHLLLIGGNSDIVVEHRIGEAEPAEATEAEPAVLAGAREAPALQRQSPRRSLAATPAAPALTVEPAAAVLPAPEPDAVPAPVETPAAPDPREGRRSGLARRPLLRGDGTLSGRPSPAATPEVVAAPAEPPRLAAAVATEAASEATRSAYAPKVDAPRNEHPKLDVADLVDAAQADAGAPKVERPPVAAAEGPLPELDDLAKQFDAAARAQPAPAAAEPQLNLSDLLGEAPREPKEKDAASAAPRAEPVIESPQVRPTDRPLSRFLTQSRGRAPERRSGEARTIEARPNAEPRPRIDPAPRLDRAADEAAGRPAGPQARPEPSLRPREFALRPSGDPARALPALEQPRRDFTAREADRENAPRPETASPLLRPTAAAPAGALSPEPARGEAAPREDAAPLVAPPRRDEPSLSAPQVDSPASPSQRDLLDDFDAEMADLLGRSTARGR